MIATLLLIALSACTDSTPTLDNLPAQQQPSGESLVTLSGWESPDPQLQSQVKVTREKAVEPEPVRAPEPWIKRRYSIERMGSVVVVRRRTFFDIVVNVITIAVSLVLAGLLVGFAYCYHYHWWDCPDSVNDLLTLVFIAIAVAAMGGTACLPDFYDGLPGVQARGWSACCFLLAALIGGIYMATAPEGCLPRGDKL